MKRNAMNRIVRAHEIVRARRAGFTLVEVMIALVLTAIIGAAVTSVFVSQSAFYDEQQKITAARAVSRAATNMLLTELRAVETSNGVIAAGADSLVVRVPYALGIACGTNLTTLHVSVLPVDSVVYAQASFAGYAWHDATSSAYTYVEGAGTTITDVAGASRCTAPAGGDLPITTFTAAGERGHVIGLTPVMAGAVPHASAVLLYQRVTYRFANSVIVPGQRGLWREAQGSGFGAEELAAPFDPSARFRFYVLNASVAQDAPPADLTQIRGIELVLTGRSERPDSDGAYSRTTPMTTAIFFRNRLD
ncbi:MAG: PilW family protein [Longimicrobiales bacterium]